MFVGFKINNFGFVGDSDMNFFYDKGLSMYENMEEQIKEKLSFMEKENTVLDASQIQGDWFPQIEADVFISHSHQDKKLAIALAGWLKDCFGLTAFIDSCVWGYCDDLLKIIDEKYCKNSQSNTYNYNKRNVSTGIVHIMLMNALTKMIDNTECLFFMDTDSSVPIKDNIENRTYSPWIFGELETSRIIRRIKPDRLDRQMICDTKYFSEINESIRASFPLNMEYLIDVSCTDLKNWKNNCNPCNPSQRIIGFKDFMMKKQGVDALNQLYLQKGIISKNNCHV